VRDPSSIILGIVMPVMLIVLFGYALSLDVRNIPVALVVEDASDAASEIAAGFLLSPYFEPRFTPSMIAAERAMLANEVSAIVRIPATFTRNAVAGNSPAAIQIVVHGADANTARITQAYAQGAVAQAFARRAAAGESISAAGPVVVEPRLWFNEANNSHYFLVPGLIVLIMTLIGAFLTALVMAREWERGTLEAIFVTPVRAGEILLGKIIPYFVMGMIGLTLCVVAAQVLFHVPLRGSILVLAVVSSLYLLVALGIGLAASATRSQFLASQIALLATFLPAMLLSGFLFDIRSMPAFLQAITIVLPARYFVTLLKTIFLAGDLWVVILPNTAVLAVMAAVLMAVAARATRKKLA
jgi:ABC-2 type transport system permease protein